VNSSQFDSSQPIEGSNGFAARSGINSSERWQLKALGIFGEAYEAA
jgi:hypothetical protein